MSGYEAGVQAERRRITAYLVDLIRAHKESAYKHRWRDAFAMRYPDNQQVNYLTGLIRKINGWDDAMTQAYIRVALDEDGAP